MVNGSAKKKCTPAASHEPASILVPRLDSWIALVLSLVVTPAAVLTALQPVEISNLLSGLVFVAYQPALVVLCLHVVAGLLVITACSQHTAMSAIDLLRTITLIVNWLKQIVLCLFTSTFKVAPLQPRPPVPRHGLRPVTCWTTSSHPQLVYE